MRIKEFAIVLLMICSTLWAFTAGNGTQENPYQISTQADLEAVNNNLAASYILMNDIDLSGTTYTASVIAPDTSTDWGFQGTEFSGSFDGDGFKISNLTIDGARNQFIALFGRTSKSSNIVDMTMDNCNIIGGRYIGGLVGFSAGYISRICVNGTVTGTHYIGGLVGWDYSTNINLSYSTAIVVGGNYVGGLVGDSNGGRISNCYATGNVTGNSNMGGLVGSHYGTILNCYSSGIVTGESKTGGLVSSGAYDISASFWDIEASGLEISEGGEGWTTEYMQTVGIFANSGWDFVGEIANGSDDIWLMLPDNYPLLTWQEMPQISGFSVAFSVGSWCASTDGEMTQLVAEGDSAIAPIVTPNESFEFTGWDRDFSNVESNMIVTAEYRVTMPGDGTVENPYQISTQSDLEAINNDLAASYILMNDIDLSGTTYTKAVIAPNVDDAGSFEGAKFTGNFDGNGFVIANLTIDAGVRDNYIGLFGAVGSLYEHPTFEMSARIKDLGLLNGNITGGSSIGGLIGWSYFGVISDCYFEGTIVGSYCIGGLIGDASAAEITRCYSKGEVNGIGYYLGGLIGLFDLGYLSKSYSTADVIGETGDSNEEEPSFSYFLGGLIGQNDEASISNCYATGYVTGSDRIGGLIGANGGDVTDCYSVGHVSGDNGIGGFAGSSTDTISSCFWDTQTSGQTVGVEYGTTGGITGKTTIEMKTYSTFMYAHWEIDYSWDFVEEPVNDWDHIWIISDDTYPVLRWQDNNSELFGVTFIVGDDGEIVSGQAFQVVEQGDSATAPAIAVNQNRRFVGWDTDFSNVQSHLTVTAQYIEVETFEVTFDAGDNGEIVDSQAIQYLERGYSAVAPKVIANECWKFVGWDVDFSNVQSDFTVIAQYIEIGPSDGTPENPYRISTVQDLEAVNNNLDASYILINDIDMAGIVYPGAIIATNAVETADFVGEKFTGSFNGNGFNIFNLKIYDQDHCNHYLGLFGYIDGGEVKNLTLWNCNVYGDNPVGALVGWNTGSIINCHAIGLVTGDYYVGGLVGWNTGSVTNCHSNTNIEAYHGMGGGLVGNNRGSITGCYSEGSIEANGSYVGGLVYANNGSISNCYSICDVVCHGDFAGGLVASNSGEIIKCYSAGALSSQGSIGGFAARNYGTVLKSYWDKEVSGVETSEAGEGKTTVQMQTIQTFIDAGWDFVDETANGTNNIWMIRDNNYPTINQPIPFMVGYGTPENPYQISTQADLEAVNNNLAASYILVNDIDLSEITYTSAVIAPDTSLSLGFQGTKFTGVLDGNGFAISNLIIDANIDSDCIGLFGCINTESQVKNIALIDCDITGYYHVGGLVGLNDGVVTQSYVTGRVTGDWYTGGLVGYNFHGIISESYSDGAVSGNGNVGGLVGYNPYGDILNSYSICKVTGGQDVGGLCGRNRSGNISNCFWDIEMSELAVSAGGLGKTTFEMQTLSTFIDAGWDFVGEGDNGDMEVWYMVGGDSPRLYWEAQRGDINYDGFVDEFDLDVIISQWLVQAFEDQRLTADIDGSGTVDNVDLCILADALRPPSADINSDGVVDEQDLGTLCNNWLAAGDNQADINGDGLVDIVDYSLLAAQWLAGN